MSKKVRAALRDASWFRNPSTHGKVVYHVVVNEPATLSKTGISACGKFLIAAVGFAPLRDVTINAASVRLEQRCGLPGCRVRWPTLEP